MNTARKIARLQRRPGFTLMEIILVMGIFSTAVLMVMTIITTSTKVQHRTIVSQRLTADARYTVETIARTIRSGRLDYDFHFALPASASSIDPPVLQAPMVPLHILAIVDQDGNRTIFRRTCQVTTDPWCLKGDSIDPTNGLVRLGNAVEVCLESNICVEGSDFADASKMACNSDLDCANGGHANESCQLSCTFEGAWNDITPSGVRLTGGASYPNEPYGLKFVVQPRSDPFTYNPEWTDGYGSNEQPLITVIMVTKGTEGPDEERKITTVQTTVTPRSYLR
jgi:type II secretory pathway pseudopilin PulG